MGDNMGHLQWPCHLSAPRVASSSHLWGWRSREVMLTEHSDLGLKNSKRGEDHSADREGEDAGKAETG